MIIKRTLKWVVSEEQKFNTEEIINLSCTHLCLNFCILLYRTQETTCMYTCPSNLVHHTDVVCLCPHITVLAHWAKIICLHICLTPDPVVSGWQSCQGLVHMCIFSSSTWLHIHYMCTERIKSSHVRKCSKLPGRAFTTSRLPGGTTITKRSPYCLILSWIDVT